MKPWVYWLGALLLLVILAGAARWWLPPWLSFVGTNNDAIQGSANLIQLILWGVAGFVGIIGYLRRPKSRASQAAGTQRGAESSPSKVPNVDTRGGNYYGSIKVNTGDFVGGDKTVISSDSARSKR